MKAAIYRRYGPPEVLQIEELPVPTPSDDEVLVNVYASSVNPYDYHFRSGILPLRLMSGGWMRPKRSTLGLDVAGTVEHVGKNVQRFKAGDKVYGFSGAAYAEYAAMPERLIAAMPGNLSFRQAAALPLAALTALQALRDHAQIKNGHKVLIYGASGGIGTVAVQLAKYFGGEVTAACSTQNLPWVAALGADKMLDYTNTDFRRSGTRYDVIFKVMGTPTFFNSRRSLAKDGRWVAEDASVALSFVTMLFGGKRAKVHMTKPHSSDLDFIRTLVEAGKITPVIDSCFPLDQVAVAHRHAERRRGKGRIVVQVKEE
jgi:NADPH:quinone reductase-like Zn-dependent oxidoreductase